MKKIFNTPEAVLVGLGIFWLAERYLTSGRLGYVTMLVTWLLFLQIIYKNRVCGLIYGVTLTIVSSYKLYLAYLNIGDVSTVKTIEYACVFILALVMAVGMIHKYLRAKESYDESVLTITY